MRRDRGARRDVSRPVPHRVEVIVATVGAHLAMVSDATGDDAIDAEQRVYDRASRLGPAVCVALELPVPRDEGF